MKLAEQIVIVTGSNGAVGSVVTERLKLTARHVVAVSRGAAVEFRPIDKHHSVLKGNLANPESVHKMISAMATNLDSGHALVNIAGGFSLDGPLDGISPSAWDHMMKINFNTCMNMCRELLPIFKAQGFGRIINFGSQAGDAGMAGAIPYAVSKAAVHALTRSLAIEGGGIVTANLIIPNVIDTPANREAMPEADFSRWTKPETIADHIETILDETDQPPNGQSIRL
ncbi:MAG: SDR family NAD(P)-dependent oxidoreductase [Candidatus Marinimicrobia bacterium]|nr:SDR family NAD(P)-dependent oxidoreductase [Candidatus Neomarinimicrobiota bacterium]